MTRRRAWLGVLILIGACVPNPNFEGSGDDGTATEEGTVPTCGDGIVDEGEDCDDGNASNNDACLNDCRAASCRDGHVWQGHEQCDDGNTSNADGCLNSCNTARCGDGLIQQGVESCDDGNISNTDACTSTCEFAICGDGFIHVGVEACDDGDLVDNDACPSTCEHASCGDGFVHAEVEACDDGNVSDNDGCSSSCDVEPNLVFVTSDTYTGNLGGLAGADDKCQQLAALGSLPGQYMAWLSDSSDSPSSRFSRSERPYLLVDGTVIADGWTDLTDGSIAAAIQLSESGQLVSAYAWTATVGSGTLSDDNFTCLDWTDGTVNASGHVGVTIESLGGWSLSSSSACSSNRRLYCFRQLP